MNNQHTYSTDAEWYCTHGKYDGSDEYYDIFFGLCNKFGVSWIKATKTEKIFIEQMAKYQYDLKVAARNGFSKESVAVPFTF